MIKPGIGVAAIAVVSAMFLASSAHAASNECAASKILSVSKTVKSTFTCASKQAAGKLDGDGYNSCVQKAVLKQGLAFTKAEAAGACSGSSTGCATINGLCKVVAEVEIATHSQAIRPTLWKIAAKYEKARLGCVSKLYKGSDPSSVAACNAAAVTNLNEACSKTDDGGATADPTGLALTLASNCEAGVYADATDTAKICRLCSETRDSGTAVGCTEADADDIIAGVAAANAQFSGTNPTVSFQAIGPDKSYCDGDSGACVATGPSTRGTACCFLTIGGQPACSVGPLTSVGTCTALTGGPNYVPGDACVDGKTCVP